jgi:hypothetical protein
LASVTSKALIRRKKGGVLSAAPQNFPGLRTLSVAPSGALSHNLVRGKGVFADRNGHFAGRQRRNHDLSAVDFAGV